LTIAAGVTIVGILMRPLPLALLLFTAPLVEAAAPVRSGTNDSVVKMPLAGGVSLDDAVQAMKLKANLLNMKLVGELPLSKQLQAMGQQSRRLEIFQFCDPLTAKKMVEHDLSFAAYLPCRITLVEDDKGRGWLVMLKLDPLIEGADLSPALKRDALKVRDTLNEIMRAGANGDL
jgi:uncharacterized protein (DUF302 family)